MTCDRSSVFGMELSEAAEKFRSVVKELGEKCEAMGVEHPPLNCKLDYCICGLL